MKINYDSEADALYIELSSEKPEGVIEIKEGVNLDVSKDGRIIGMEFLDASKKLPLESFYTYEIAPDIIKRAG